MTEDLLSGDFNTETPFEETLFYKIGRTLVFYGVRLGVSLCIAEGFWYLTVAANGLARYSPIAETGRNLIFIGLFLLLFLTGDPDV